MFRKKHPDQAGLGDTVPKAVWDVFDCRASQGLYHVNIHWKFPRGENLYTGSAPDSFDCGIRFHGTLGGTWVL